MLVGFALSFFPMMHVFAGVSVPYPENYFQWFLAGSTRRSCRLDVDARSRNNSGVPSKIFAGLAGVSLALGLAC